MSRSLEPLLLVMNIFMVLALSNEDLDPEVEVGAAPTIVAMVEASDERRERGREASEGSLMVDRS